jgi:hypothetical protein
MLISSKLQYVVVWNSLASSDAKNMERCFSRQSEHSPNCTPHTYLSKDRFEILLIVQVYSDSKFGPCVSKLLHLELRT